MEPTADEGLIRDYLNRLSVAAQSRLRSDDRRALVARTREFLERRSAELGDDGSGGLRDALSALGEPVEAVENEYARLAAERHQQTAARPGPWRPRGSAGGEPAARAGDADPAGDADAGSDANADPADPDPGADPDAGAGPGPAPDPRELPRVAVDVSHLAGRELKGDIEKKVKANRPLTSRWRPGSPVKQRPARSYRIPRPRAEASQPGEPNGALPAGPDTGERPAGSPAPGSSAPGSPTLATPAAEGPGAPPTGSARGTAGSAAGSAEGLGTSASRPSGGVGAQASRPASVITSRLPRVQRSDLSDAGRGLAAGVARVAREHRLETAAVVLMLLCGLIYPIVSWVLGFSLWLLGAILAAASRQWSLWEKWTGLLGPVALVIAGTSVGLSLGGQHHGMAPYVHEVLADSRTMIKIAAVLGAVYLAWRAHRGRSHRVPPWNRPHRF
jgi:hypothetical protein